MLEHAEKYDKAADVNDNRTRFLTLNACYSQVHFGSKVDFIIPSHIICRTILYFNNFFLISRFQDSVLLPVRSFEIYNIFSYYLFYCIS